jgi:hypothetical protein
MNKKIIFGNGEANLADMETKQKVINYLYSKVDLSKYRYIMLNNISKLKFLQDNEHYVSPNFKGYNYLLIMCMLNGKSFTFAIDRKKLSYHKSQIDLKNLSVFQLNVKTSETIFGGTIFDGKIIQTPNEMVFLIQDCYYIMGNKMLEMEMNQKMTYLDSIFKTHFRKDNPQIKELNGTSKNTYCENFDFKLNKLYTYDLLEKLIEGLPNLPISSTGIIFFPKFSGINVIHLDKKIDKVNINTNNNEVIEQKSYHVIKDFVDFLKSRTYSYESGNKNKVLWLSRTITPDVYDISENENGDKMGIALIPNLKISQMCDNLIDDKPVKFNCVFSNKFKKYIPIHTI